jgi:putative SOS response-associated peptidase YedK
MVAKYSFNSHYRPEQNASQNLPSLRLLEGGIFQPHQFSPVVVQEDAQMRLRFFRWGLQTAWERVDQNRKPRNIVSADQVLQQPEYQLPIRTQRCLVPADGYYLNHQDRVYKLSHPNEDAFCFAGIYATHRMADGTYQSTFAILSTPAQGKQEKFGLQMPLILPKNLEKAWINHHAPLQNISQILYRPDRTTLNVHPVEELQALPAYEELYRQVAA